MSKKTAKERVKVIHDFLSQNKKIKTISELAKILKISSLVPRMLKNENVLMYNAFGKVIWNVNVLYTVELEERIYNKTLDYARESDVKCKEAAKVKALVETLNNDIICSLEEKIGIVDTVNTVVPIEENDLQLINSSITKLHEKIDALTAKVSSLQVETKQRPRTKMIVTPSTNVSSKHNYFSEDL
jgi:hypothetical protein